MARLVFPVLAVASVLAGLPSGAEAGDKAAKKGKDAVAVPETAAGTKKDAAKAEELLVQGEEAFLAGDEALALEKFRQAIEADPERWEPYYYCGLVLHGQGDLAGAAAMYRDAISKKPDASEALNNLAAVLIEQGDLAGALEASRKAVKADPQNYEAAYTLAQILEATGEIDEAIAAYEASAALAPGDPDPMIAVADLRLGKGDQAGAAAALLEAFERAPHQMKLGLMALELMLKAGKNDDGLALARKLAKRMAGKADADPEAAVRVARTLRKLGDAQAALDLLAGLDDEAKKIFPVQTEIGMAYLALGQCSKAAKAFDAAIGLEPGSLQAKIAKADALCCAGKWWKAKKAYKKVLKAAPPGDPGIAAVEAKLSAGKKSCKH